MDALSIFEPIASQWRWVAIAYCQLAPVTLLVWLVLLCCSSQSSGLAKRARFSATLCISGRLSHSMRLSARLEAK